MKRIVSYTAALFVACVVLMAFVASPAYASTILGDSNVEPVTTTIVPQYVMALTKFTVSGSTTITSVSLYVQYTGSDGSQCLKFGIYADNGKPYGLSSPFGEPLVAATRNGYCFQTGDFGPAWETWTLLPGDTMELGSGTYWLCMLALEGYGTVYHFTYTGAYGGQTLYQYGYFYYGFPASYTLGYPYVSFGNLTITNANLILPFNVNNPGEYDAPFSFYATGA